MRRIFNVLATILLTASLFGQSPEKMSYQAVIRNTSNQLVSQQQVGMQVSIIQGSISGQVVYSEIQSPSTNANGLVSIEIGVGASSDDFSSIDWANGPYFVKTETDPAGGTDYTITGTSQLLSVPYALHAKTAENLSGTITETDPLYTGSAASNITAADISNLGNLSGVNSGDQDLSAFVSTLDLNEAIQWEKNDSGIAYNSGNVGIGAINPAAKLDIVTNSDSAVILKLSTDRPWQFEQIGIIKSTALHLRSLGGGKRFNITDYTHGVVASF